MDTPFSQPAAEPQRNYLPLIAGAVLVIVIVGALVVLSRKPQAATGEQALDPYASNLQIGDIHLSSAQNFAGATVFYIEGKIANTGDKTVTGARVQAIFRNALGEVVDKPTENMMLLHERPGYTDVKPLSSDPLTPNKVDEFRLTFEHISADWNQGLPELRVVKVSTK